MKVEQKEVLVEQIFGDTIQPPEGSREYGSADQVVAKKSSYRRQVR